MENKIIKIYDLEEEMSLKIVRKPLNFLNMFKHKAIKKKNMLSGNVVDFLEETKINQEIGYWGESFVFNYERKHVESYNLDAEKQVKWVSKDEGDGLGYDILSYDSEGNEIYIEVKTTKGKEKASFYITANELQKSEQEGENYYIYRVYNFDMKKKYGEISIIKGSLKEYCIMPQVYRVEFE